MGQGSDLAQIHHLPGRASSVIPEEGDYRILVKTLYHSLLFLYVSLPYTTGFFSGFSDVYPSEKLIS